MWSTKTYRKKFFRQPKPVGSECKGGVKIRNSIIRFKFRKELQKIAIFFKEEKNFNLINSIFSNVWQQDPKKTNPKYHKIKEKNSKREIEVLKCVVKFVQHTKRFKKERFGI